MGKIIAQECGDRYAAFNADCMEVLPDLGDNTVHLSVYSPPFAELYNYSSSERDMSNCKSIDEFLQHYSFLVKEIARVTKPGRVSCVHCMDIRKKEGIWRDFAGDIIRLHEQHGFHFHSRFTIWKEPLRVAIRTRSLGLMHKQIVKDSTRCHAAMPDYLLVFLKQGENKEPVTHAHGLTRYAGATIVPETLRVKYANWKDPKTNKLAHWIWQHYASSVWMDIRAGRLMPYKPARETDEEKHVCPLQLDVIERCVALYSNPADTVLTPFMGVGSECCGALGMGRRAIGVELKETYYRQALRNIHETIAAPISDGGDLFAGACEYETTPEDFEE